MELTREFKNLNKNDAPIAGGKGASLGEMTQAGIPVPPGFVVLSQAFEYFIDRTGLNVEIDTILHGVDHREIHTVEKSSEKIKGLIIDAEMPKDIEKAIISEFKKLDAKYVAVRSSATAEDGAENAWAGQLDSYLNTTEENVLEKVKHCWASLFTPRAIFYRFEKGLHGTKISVAVVVQKMVESECSGIAFSVHPVTEDENQLIIEAGFGLGEAIVSGQITPDSYVVEKNPRGVIAIADVNVSTQTRALYRAQNGGNEWIDIPEPKASSQVLTGKQILELSKIIIRIEKHYGFPCDIEWAFENGKFYIVQSRPITTLSSKQTPKQSEPGMVEKIKTTDWRKNWAGTWSLLECCSYGYEYTTLLDKTWGKGLETVIFQLEKGSSTNYISADETRLFSEHLAHKLEDEKQISAYLKELKLLVSKTLEFLKRTKIENYTEYQELWKVQDAFLVYNFPTKRLPEYLSPALAEKFLPEFQELRKQGEPIYEKSQKLIKQFASEVGKKTDLPEHLITCLTLAELDKFFNDGSLPARKELESRYELSILVVRGIECRVFTGKEAQSLIENISKAKIGNELRGQTGYPGIVRGTVKIIKNPNEVNLMSNDMILVTGMTRPEYLPFFKKAVAVVTDAGGVLSHAAITARELKKPTVVGTEVATQILKDGDMVEVDADNGVVRIIENKSQFISPGLEDFKPEEWDYIGHWKQDLFPGVFWSDCFIPEIVERMRITSDGVWAMTMNMGHYFVKNSERINLKDQVSEKIINKDKDFFENLVKVTDEVCLVGVKVGEGLRDKKPTPENFRKFVEEAKRINFVWLLGASHFNEASEERMQDTVVAESFPAEKVLDIIPTIITPLYYRHKELIELKKQVGSKSLEEIKKDRNLYAKMKDQVEKYPWVEVFNFIGAPLTVERLYEQVVHVEVDQPKRPDIAVSPELKWRADCMNKCGYVKQAAAEYFSIYSERVLPFLNKVAEKIGLTYREFMAINTLEAEQALKGELTVAELKKRVNRRLGVYNYAFIALKDGKTLFIEEPSDIVLMKKMIPKADKDAGEVRGTCGNPGKYTGPAKIIMNTDDFPKMKSGDVLVTTMTTPDFVILMQKSGAIVTDIGGLLCHAAIISREMNKPCVIGTKFATQILKDGDMVEVDADNGVVRILDKK